MDFQEKFTGKIETVWTPEPPFATPTAFLMSVLVHFSEAPTTSEKFTLSYATEKGEEFETEIFSVDPVNPPSPAVGPLTDIFVSQSSLEIPLQAGESIKIAYPNTDGRTIGVTLKAKYVA